MLHLFRRFLNTWAARAFFIVLIGSFGLWGISGTVRDLATDTALATIGKRRIEPGEFQDALRQQMAQVTRSLGGTEPTPEIRRAVAGQTLDRLVTQAALAEEAKVLGLVTPDAALTKAVHDIPAFQGRTGTFDRQQFNGVMRQNNLTEARFLDLMRADLTQQQMMQPVQGGVAAPDTPARALYAYQNETRTAEYVEFAFAAAPAPAPATADDLQRFYENNAARYSAPEYRRIKTVVLSPDGLLRDVTVPDEDVATYFQGHRGEFVKPERRSVQVVIAPDRDAGTAIATPWIAGEDWAAVQAQAADRNASAAELTDALPADFPAPEVAVAVFEAPSDQVTGPVQSPQGWLVFRVTKVDGGANPTLADAGPAIRTRLARERAADLVYARTTQLEDAIAADPTLDSIPADLGAEPATGELDRNGDTRGGDPAPLPGPTALRPILIGAAFQQARGDLPHLTEGPDGSYWALIVEDTETPKLKPYDEVATAVTADWAADQRRRSQDTAAAQLLATVKTGAKLDDAAIVQGLRVQRTPPVPRPDGKTPSPVPEELAQSLFTLRPGEPTMVETADSFLVATVADITAPAFGADPVAATALRTALNQSLGADVAATFAGAIRTRARPTINRAMLDSFLQ